MKKILLIIVLLVLLMTDSVNKTNAYNTDYKMKKEFVLNDKSKKISYFDKSIKIEYSEVLYENIKGTVYHAEPNQTDNTPLYTADMSFIDTSKVNQLRWVALSRDLLNRKYTDPKGNKNVWSGKIKFGDTIWIEYDDKNIKKKLLKKDSTLNIKEYVRVKSKYEKIKGYWVVHDVMGTQYYQTNYKGQYILDSIGNKQIVEIKNAIDFLQHRQFGMIDLWDGDIIIKKKYVDYINYEKKSLTLK
jgi:hypothetical protein